MLFHSHFAGTFWRFVEAVKSHIEKGANGKEEEEAPSTDQEVTVTPETKDMFNE